MIGAIAGDIIGSVYEARPIKRKDFPLFDPRCTFTDDSVLTIAVASAILAKRRYRDVLWETGRRYPHAGYGGSFIRWLLSENPQPYNSWGNVAAMRVSPVGFAFGSIEEVLEQARLTAVVSHNHPEGIKGAQAVALAIFMGRKGKTKNDIRQAIGKKFDYNLSRTIEEIRPSYFFDVSCQGSVPQAIIAFLQSDDVESAIRLAVSLGGDSDTQASITGAIAHAFYKELPEQIEKEVRRRLPQEFVKVLDAFLRKYAG